MPNSVAAEKIVCLITEGTLDDANFADSSPQLLEKIRFAATQNLSVIQIREKKLSTRNLFELTRKAVKVSLQTTTKIIVNDRLDVALAADADGVQLTSSSMSVGKALEIVRKTDTSAKRFWIGVSAHSLADCQKAQRDGADFALFSPIFATPHKGIPVGTEHLQNVRRAVEPFPIIALGGIASENLPEVLPFADGFAAIRFFADESNIIAAGQISRRLAD